MSGDSEKERLKNLDSYDIIDTPQEKEFDDIVNLASQICEAPISLISLIDKNRQWFKSRIGLDVEQTSRDVAFCDHAIKGLELFEVKDTFNDDRFKNNPLVLGDPNIRAYAGYPLRTEEGFNLGTLCVIFKEPNQLNEFQKNALRILSRRVVRELELRKKVRKLDSLNSFKNKILSIIGHDVRSPLNSIKSVIELIDQDLVDPGEVKSIRKALLNEVNSTRTLLDNILEWSSIYLEGKENTASVFAVKDVVEECLDLLSFELERKRINIVQEISDETAFGDTEMIKLVIRNIIGNAIKFSNKGDTIRVTASKKGQVSRLSIVDEGVGMSQEQIDRLLNRKGGVSALGTTNERGSGIGMLLSLEFLEINKGSLSIESKENEGSTFVIKLPSSKRSL